MTTRKSNSCHGIQLKRFGLFQIIPFIFFLLICSANANECRNIFEKTELKGAPENQLLDISNFFNELRPNELIIGGKETIAGTYLMSKDGQTWTYTGKGDPVTNKIEVRSHRTDQLSLISVGQLEKLKFFDELNPNELIIGGKETIAGTYLMSKDGQTWIYTGKGDPVTNKIEVKAERVSLIKLISVGNIDRVP